jgi:hypothetical protein
LVQPLALLHGGIVGCTQIVGLHLTIASVEVLARILIDVAEPVLDRITDGRGILLELKLLRCCALGSLRMVQCNLCTKGEMGGQGSVRQGGDGKMASRGRQVHQRDELANGRGVDASCLRTFSRMGRSPGVARSLGEEAIVLVKFVGRFSPTGFVINPSKPLRFGRN